MAPRVLLANTTGIVTGSNSTAASNYTATEVAPYARDLNGVDRSLDTLSKQVIWWTLGVLAMLILCIRLAQRAFAHSRHVGTMHLLGGAEQAYWAKNKYSAWWKFKKHMLYAPFRHKRHNREFRLSKAFNMGTIPSRFHTILIAIYLILNIVFLVDLDYTQPNHFVTIAELRGRSGVLAVINMVPLIIFAGRNNPLISLLKISFDTYNLMHRWIGRLVVIHSVIHTICWAVVEHAGNGWHGVFHVLETDASLGWGCVGTVAMVLILILSLSPIRHAFYETFVNVHMILALATIIGIWVHCDLSKIVVLPVIQAVFALWMLERLWRWARIAYQNYSRKAGWTRATLVAMPCGATRVTMHLPRQVKVKPGSHAYLRFAGINPWESHPFSIAWAEDKTVHDVSPSNLEKGQIISEKGAIVSERPADAKVTTDVSFVIQAQTGMTKKLFSKTKQATSRTLTVKAACEGPYGGHHSLDSYGHVVLFAGSSGITHQIPFVKHLIQGFNDYTVSTRKITLVWVIRETEQLGWVREWMDEILHMPRRKEILQIKLFITRPKNKRDIHSPSTTVQMTAARPNVKVLMREEVENQKGAMCVTVCGPGSLADDVREAVREVQDVGVVDFIEESFTW